MDSFHYLSKVHERQPFFLKENQIDSWIKNDKSNIIFDEIINFHKVSTEVNKIWCNSNDLISELQDKINNYSTYLIYLMLSIIKIFFIASFNILVLFELQSKPVGKGLSCFSEEDSVNNNYESFRGLYFESDNSIRVVSFKSKNKSLKIISKLTPYKISENL